MEESPLEPVRDSRAMDPRSGRRPTMRRLMPGATARTDSGRAHAPAESTGWGRVPELDALRGLAAIAVLTYHLRSYWLPRAWIAVDLFFVVSGYLITSIILKHGRDVGFLGTFYLRRILRITPVYLLAIAALAVFDPLLPKRCDFAGLPFHLTYLHTLNRYGLTTIPEFSPYLLHTWTIAVEEQFYLLWPLLLWRAGAGACWLSESRRPGSRSLQGREASTGGPRSAGSTPWPWAQCSRH